MDPVNHFEVPADDTSRAQKFYSKVFGWEMQDIPMGEGNVYTIIRTGKVDKDNMLIEKGMINGGMYKRESDENPTIVITVKDIKKAIDDIKSAGGKLLEGPTEVPKMGLYAKFEDTEKNIMGIGENLME